MSILMNKKSIAWGKILLVTLAFLALIIVVLPNKASAQYEDDGFDHFLRRSENPIPGMGSITPKSVKYQDNITNITIEGRGFLPNSVARWNGQNRPTIYIDYNHIIIQLNSEDLRSPNGGYINVYNPNRQAYSNAIKLKVSGYVASNNNQNNNTNNYPAQNNGNANTSYNNGGSDGGNNYNNSLLSYTNTGDSSRNTNGSYSSNENQNGSNGNGQNVGTLAAGAIFGSNSFAPSGIIQWVLFAIVILLIVIIVRKFFGGADKYHNTPLKHA